MEGLNEPDGHRPKAFIPPPKAVKFQPEGFAINNLAAKSP
jgi:hypothetical protein